MEYISIYFLSMVKFIAGPSMGPLLGFTYAETVLVTILGMMTSVVIFTFFGMRIRNWYQKKRKKAPKKFTKRNRRFVSIWKKYGLFGIAFLTPIIFTPIGGALLASTLGGERRKILFYMLCSAIFWSMVFSSVFHFLLKDVSSFSI